MYSLKNIFYLSFSIVVVGECLNKNTFQVETSRKCTLLTSHFSLLQISYLSWLNFLEYFAKQNIMVSVYKTRCSMASILLKHLRCGTRLGLNRFPNCWTVFLKTAEIKWKLAEKYEILTKKYYTKYVKTIENR